ncbi:hypothetical protein ACW7EJ_01610, partial [Acinetobacter soli]
MAPYSVWMKLINKAWNIEFDSVFFQQLVNLMDFERLLVCPLDIGRILICSRFIWIEAHLVQRV